MRKIVIPLLAILLCASSCTKKALIDKDAENKAIQTVLVSMFKSFSDADIEALKTFLTEDFLAFDMAKIMKLEDLSTAISGMAQMGITDLKYSIDLVQSDIYENTALYCYKNVLTGKMGGQEMNMEFIESCFLQKTDEGWKIKFLHSTQVPPPDAPNPEAG